SEELEHEHRTPDRGDPDHPPVAAGGPIDQREKANDKHEGREMPEELEPAPDATAHGCELRIAAAVSRAEAGADAHAAPGAADVDALEFVVRRTHRAPPVRVSITAETCGATPNPYCDFRKGGQFPGQGPKCCAAISMSRELMWRSLLMS